MASPALHTVVSEYGTFTRRSHRTYTHAVICLGRVESWLVDRQAAERRWVTKERDQYQGVIDNPQFTEDYKRDYRRWVDGMNQKLAAMPTMDAQALEANRLAVAEKRGACLGWSMSERSAQRAARTWASKGYASVQVVTVTTRG